MKNALVDALVPVVAKSCKGVIGYIRHEVIGSRKEDGSATTERQPRVFYDRSDMVIDMEDDVSRE